MFIGSRPVCTATLCVGLIVNSSILIVGLALTECYLYAGRVPFNDVGLSNCCHLVFLTILDEDMVDILGFRSSNLTPRVFFCDSSSLMMLNRALSLFCFVCSFSSSSWYICLQSWSFSTKSAPLKSLTIRALHNDSVTIFVSGLAASNTLKCFAEQLLRISNKKWDGIPSKDCKSVLIGVTVYKGFDGSYA